MGRSAKQHNLIEKRKQEHKTLNHLSAVTGNSRRPSSTSYKKDAGRSLNSLDACKGQARAHSSPLEKHQSHTRVAARAGASGGEAKYIQHA